MKNIERRGDRFRAQIHRRGVRISKTFETPELAAHWLREQRAIIASGGRLELPPPRAQRRTDYGAVTFSAARTSELLSEADILVSATPRERVCGVYFLIVGRRVMYVGQSIDVHARIADHVRLGKVFDACHVVPCRERDAKLLESRYIIALRPAWNVRRDGVLLLSVTKHAFAA